MECIKSCVRIRPDLKQQEHILQVTTSNTIIVESSVYSFDHVWNSNATQQDIFDKVGIELCSHALEGFNATLFCYGQTGTGKTWTMQGSTGSNLPNDPKDNGLIQRTFQHILHLQSQAKQLHGDKIEFSNRVSSFVEIYNEQIFDLLDPSIPSCQIREAENGGTYVMGATSRSIETADDAINILEIGAKNRSTASTDLNARSSRSHSILTLTIRVKTMDKGI